MRPQRPGFPSCRSLVTRLLFRVICPSAGRETLGLLFFKLWDDRICSPMAFSLQDLFMPNIFLLARSFQLLPLSAACASHNACSHDLASGRRAERGSLVFRLGSNLKRRAVCDLLFSVSVFGLWDFASRSAARRFLSSAPDVEHRAMLSGEGYAGSACGAQHQPDT